MGDLLYNFTDWLRGTPLTELALWISDTSLCLWIVTHFWALPVIQVTHILAIAGSFASLLMINARMFGIAGSSSMEETSHRYTRVLWGSLVVLVLSGLLMIIAEPVRELINPIFWIKMVLVVFGTLAVIGFQKMVLRHVSGERPVRGSDKLAGVLLVILWCVIMLCGRWIAYAPVQGGFRMSFYPAPTNIWESIEYSSVGTAIAESTWMFPTLETFHVIGLVTVLSMIAIVDLRLIGVASRQLAVTKLSKDTLPWVWGAFGLAALTGLLLFVSKASSYVANPYFLWKMGMLALAGLNMMYLHLTTLRTVEHWDLDPTVPFAAKLAGGLSLVFWLLVVFFGRAIGFTLGIFGA